MLARARSPCDAELVESLGNESLLHFSTDARTVRNRSGVFTADPGVNTLPGTSRARLRPKASRASIRASGSLSATALALAVDVDRLHFFDAETGDTIGAAGALPVVSLRTGQT